MPIKIYLDDLRFPPENEGWTIVRTVEETIELLKNGDVEEISFDHDLGIDEISNTVRIGMEVLSWLEKEVAINGKVPPTNMQVHSANPVGRDNMLAAIRSINRFAEINLKNSSRA